MKEIFKRTLTVIVILLAVCLFFPYLFVYYPISWIITGRDFEESLHWTTPITDYLLN